ncbi:MAG TPA: PqqD family protein [Actinophytocola sp.]|nr:PqqD family protein [Actinophytocola sp.]
MRLRSTDISARTIGDETIILSLPDSQYFSVTGIGTRVVELLGEERTLDELVDTIVGEYEVAPEVARRDVEAFVGRLTEARLVR